MLSYWYDIVIEDINNYPLSSSWYSRHHQENHHFINRSKGGLLSNLLGACTETSAPDFVCHQKLLTAEIQDQERTKDPNKMGFLKDLGCIDRSLVCFSTKNNGESCGYLVQWIYMVQENFIVFARNYYTKWTLKQSVLQWCPCTLRPNVVCEKNHSPAWIWFRKGVGWQKKCLIMI